MLFPSANANMNKYCCWLLDWFTDILNLELIHPRCFNNALRCSNTLQDMIDLRHIAPFSYQHARLGKQQTAYVTFNCCPLSPITKLPLQKSWRTPSANAVIKWPSHWKLSFLPDLEVWSFTNCHEHRRCLPGSWVAGRSRKESKDTLSICTVLEQEAGSFSAATGRNSEPMKVHMIGGNWPMLGVQIF